MKPKTCHLVGGSGMGWTGDMKATLPSSAINSWQTYLSNWDKLLEDWT